MLEPDVEAAIGPALTAALDARGFTALTAVQRAVLDPALVDKDLRITSQTGSGKTVAIGFVLRDAVAEHRASGGRAHPRAIVIAPTRELAQQVHEELGWLYAAIDQRVVSLTGGTSAMDERRSLSRDPAVVVATPGRLLDAIERQAILLEDVHAVVLDEADRLLDMGFRDELDAIFAKLPSDRRTHLVSATFAADVRSLADRVQANPTHVEGTRLGAANTDIEHVIHLVEQRQKLDALVNLLLASPDDVTLVFARTRADVANVAEALSEAGFAVSALSGEMQQRERNRALAGFKKGDLKVLVATDVAARGLDVQDVARVVQMEPPTDADTYTHRSGRTGRAGKKGTSVMLVSPVTLSRAVMLLRRARVAYRFAPVPTAEELRDAMAKRAFEALTNQEAEPFDDRTWGLAKSLSGSSDPTRVIARLLQRARWSGVAEPRYVRPIQPPGERPEKPARKDREMRGRDHERAEHPGDRAPHREDRAPRTLVPPPPRESRETRELREPHAPANEGAPKAPRADKSQSRGWATFRVTWGEVHGADVRRVLAIVCRRGEIDAKDVGAIRIGPTSSTVEVAKDVAEEFASKARKPDARDPRILIRPFDEEAKRPREEKTGGGSRGSQGGERRPKRR